MTNNKKIKVLITGANGFIGRNLAEQLKNKYEIVAPGREQLDLFKIEQVGEYLKKSNFDIVIHTANINTTRRSDITPYELLNGNLSMFYNLEKYSNYFGKMYYFGSGAEYDARHYIPNMKEDYFGTYIPSEPYGFSKYIMGKMSEQENNIYDLILFGVFGKYEEWERRFISNNICKNLQGYPMTISQNVFFDYIYIDDLVQIMQYFIENKPKYKRYNICKGQKIDLFSLTKMINKVMGTDTEIIIEKSGLKQEYTGNNSRLLEETKLNYFIPFEESIEKLVLFYKKIWQHDFKLLVVWKGK